MTKHEREWHKLNYLKGCELMQANTLKCDRQDPRNGYVLALQLADLNLSVQQIHWFLLCWWNKCQFDFDELMEFAQSTVEPEPDHSKRCHHV